MPIFSGTKIEKLVSYPTTVLPNQFYLVEEPNGVTKFYLSDTSSTLHLLNESFHINFIDTTGDIILTPLDDGLIIVDNSVGGIKTVELPFIENNIEFEFWVVYGNGIILNSQYGESIRYSTIDSASLQSTDAISTLRIKGLGSSWVARFGTGTWVTV